MTKRKNRKKSRSKLDYSNLNFPMLDIQKQVYSRGYLYFRCSLCRVFRIKINKNNEIFRLHGHHAKCPLIHRAYLFPKEKSENEIQVGTLL